MIIDPRELKRRQILRLKGIESGKALIGPAEVQVHITDRCNINCKFCYYFAPGSPHTPVGVNHVPMKLFSSIVRDCVELKVDRITLSGEGDPTLHPRFYDMLKYLESKPISVSIHSNTTFPMERCRDIIRADNILVNLGASSKEGYRDVHGKNLFMRVIKNIKEMARLREKYNPNFRIKVLFIETSLNADSRESTTELVRKLGADEVNCVKAETWEFTQDFNEAESKARETMKKKWLPCYHGWFYSQVMLTGELRLCCYLQKKSITDLHQRSFKEAWFSEDYNHARRSAVSGEGYRDLVECKTCIGARHNQQYGQQLEEFKRIKSLQR